MIILMPIFSVFILFVLTKLMGYREISQFSMFDYVIGISIGSIAAEMATGIENFEKPLIAMIIYAIACLIISILTSKSVDFRKKLFGQPIFLMKDGIFYYDKLKKARLDISEVLMELRSMGYFNISLIKNVILEVNGKFSVALKNNDEELNNIIGINLIMDSEIIEKNINLLGISKDFLMAQANKEGLGKLKDIFLAVYIDDKIIFFRKCYSENKFDYIF